MSGRWSRFLGAQWSKPRSTSLKIRAMSLGARGFLVLAPLLLAAVGRPVSRAVALKVPHRKLETPPTLAGSPLPTPA